MKKAKKALLALSATLALTSVLAACGSDDKNTASSPAASGSPAAKKEAPTEINITTINYGAETPANDNALELEMEKLTNTKINVNFQPSNTYGDKFKVTIASGETPDVILTTFIYDSAVLAAIKQGAFWDLTPFMKDYPNLSNLYKDAINNTKVEGKIMGLPRPRPLVGGQGFPLLREDWLKKLNLKQPETMDDLYKVLKAFTENDPDGNGKKDTFGYIGNVAEGWMDKMGFIEDIFHGGNGHIIKDGKLLWRDLEPTEREALLWMQKTYKEGILAPDFAVIKNSQIQDFMKQGKVGMVPFSMDAGQIGDMVTALKKTVPEAELVHVPTIVSPTTGKPYYPKEGGFFGNYLISKKVPEDKVKKILAFFEYGASKEGMELANFGFKDTHFATNELGVKVTNDEFKKNGFAAYSNIWTLVDPYSRIAPKAGYPASYYERDKKVIDTRLQLGTFNNFNGVISDTDNKMGPELKKKIQDMKVKVITGKETIEAWDKYVEQLKKDPTVIKIQEELTASYNALYGKK